MSLNQISADKYVQQQKNEETTKLKLITPVLEEKWGGRDKILMEYVFTDGRISIDEFNVDHRGKTKKADYLMLYKENLILAVVEAKGQDLSADVGYAQAVEYAKILGAPFAYATNGIDLIEEDMITGKNVKIKLSDFPTPDRLWHRYITEKKISKEAEEVIKYPYYFEIGGKKPRYYQRIAINRTIEAIATGANRILLVMATGTGKTFTAFQIIWRLWKTKQKKKILFLADRNILVDQAKNKDFRPFGEAMVKYNNSDWSTSRDIYLALYQQLTSAEIDYYKSFDRDFFDLIVIDECHRSSANPDSNWHDILEYFSSATQIGMTATPRESGVAEAQAAEIEAKAHLEAVISSEEANEKERAYNVLIRATERRKEAERESNAAYFGNPIYTYSLKQGIEDGFLAPYKVISVELDIDKYGYRPGPDAVDVHGNPVEDRLYFQEDFDRNIVVAERRATVAKKISDYLKANDRYAKTIVFCEDISHCQEMVRLLENENADLVAKDHRYIMQITGDNDIGKKELDNFVQPDSKYPVIAVTSRLMSTGVDAETCENIILDRSIGSITEFKQIIGRGTRVKTYYEVDHKEKSKMYFTIIDFRKNYLKFQDPAFDGDPVTVTEVAERNPFPKTPEKPQEPEGIPVVEEKSKQVRVQGVDVTIIGEDVTYLDETGKLVSQNLDACVKNNIIMQYPTPDDFKKAWLKTNHKVQLSEELLLDEGWSKRFRIEYGYAVDDFDIILALGYGITPPMSKNQRTHNAAIANLITAFPDEKKEIVRLLLDVYAESPFESLKDVTTVFAMPKFTDLGYTPLKIIKSFFESKTKYIEFLGELENKLYE